ncbi:cytochrome o ubiquinol oxidase subunit IV [Phreatobacter sp. AB_2022a]|uniref:cytochrome o ubiquinol oxidase subunit IV n=1 Tax=Phreatobacter sp. AB_2022a TaxID=3003134 RepID=UPI000570EFF5|nr:cytochrome o ubiquinol oxidase subunit IV [Phreatobacter sp. AB_2022a]MCZ0734460.1 cytochrome o ubiquinol oxidase subunit IV [Phreatobacter sp. AB_2022a]CEJ14651.1 Cytochrome bo(3) ubiquinol oxidase subunit 4 [bacterium YEK0313]
MSSDAHHHASGEHDHGAGHGSFKGYLTGFLLSVVLTAIPFWLVMTGALGSNQATAIAITVFAAVQVVVHMVFFLHMDTRAEGGWTMMALIFTLIVVGITLAGSLWVMFHLTTNMMPTHDMGTMR